MVAKFNVVVISCQNQEIDFNHMSTLSSLLCVIDFKKIPMFDIF